MPWLLAVHIIALICWCGALLYLPALTAVTARHELAGEATARESWSRSLFTLAATPAALLTIASGTALFLLEQLVAGWLMVKLTLVTALVICHALNGWLILSLEKAPPEHLSLLCALLAATSAVLMLAIIWLVLAKPLWDG